MSYYDIIKQPVISEKAYAGMERGVYSFWVDPKATKTEIKAAVPKLGPILARPFTQTFLNAISTG